MIRALAFAFRTVALSLVLACARQEPQAAESAPPQVAPITASDTVVAFLGDSITAGFDLPSEQAFPALVQQRLKEQQLTIRALNGGVSGDTSAGGLRRVDWLLTQKPAVVVIELGGNDGLRGFAVADTEKNLREIIQKVRDAGAVPLVLGMRIPPSYGAAYSEAFAAVYTKLEHELNVATVPFFMRDVVGKPELTMPDGLHPNARGHVKLAEAVAEPLASLLQTLKSRTSR